MRWGEGVVVGSRSRCEKKSEVQQRDREPDEGCGPATVLVRMRAWPCWARCTFGSPPSCLVSVASSLLGQSIAHMFGSVKWEGRCCQTEAERETATNGGSRRGPRVLGAGKHVGASCAVATEALAAGGNTIGPELGASSIDDGTL